MAAPPLLFWFDRWDGRLGILRTVGPVSHEEALDGTDALSFSAAECPAKGDRLLWRDPDSGAWREHVVSSTSEPIAGPCRVRCQGAISELARDFVDERQLVGKTAAQALSAALETTRWECGPVTTDAGERGCMLYHMDALSAVRKVARVWGGELEAQVKLDGGRVARRAVSLRARRGRWRGARFSYAKNLVSCTRTVGAGEVYTALYGFGKGVAILDDETGEETGAYSRRLNFSEANGGSKWVGDDAARERWGRWDAGRKERVHAFGSVVFPGVTDAERLLKLTRERLARVSSPSVTWAVDAALVDGGATVRLGDDVAVEDAGGRHVRARCIRLSRSFGEGAARRRMTLGNARAAGEAKEAGGTGGTGAGSSSGGGDGKVTVGFNIGIDDEWDGTDEHGF